MDMGREIKQLNTKRVTDRLMSEQRSKESPVKGPANAMS